MRRVGGGRLRLPGSGGLSWRDTLARGAAERSRVSVTCLMVSYLLKVVYAVTSSIVDLLAQTVLAFVQSALTTLCDRQW